MSRLQNKRILLFVENLYEDLELWYPYYRLLEEGADVVIAGPEARRVYESKHGYPCRADVSFEDIKAAQFDGLVIPGGFSPDRLRRYEKVKQLTRELFNSQKLVAHICHGGWVPISAGIVRGYKCTSTPAIKDDLVNAGATWVDEPLVIDRNMVSSRRPDDLPQFCQGIIKVLLKQES